MILFAVYFRFFLRMAVLQASEFVCEHLCFLRIMILFITLSLVPVFSRYIPTKYMPTCRLGHWSGLAWAGRTDCLYGGCFFLDCQTDAIAGRNALPNAIFLSTLKDGACRKCLSSPSPTCAWGDFFSFAWQRVSEPAIMNRNDAKWQGWGTVKWILSRTNFPVW